MFRFFTRRFRLHKPPQVRISLEEQIANLDLVGIKLKRNVEVRDILDYEISEYEERPYIHLLMSMGQERESINMNGDLYSTNDVWCFDRECIEDHGDYISALQRIAVMVEPDIHITDFHDYVDIVAEEVWIAFKINGSSYRYTLNVQNDWLSLEILTIFSEWLAACGSSRRFYFADMGNEVLIVLIERDQYRRLNNLINIFIPTTDM